MPDRCPVATYASFDKTLNAGLEMVPLRMITDVTTSATHRRRGLLRRLIEDDLDDAVAQGVPVAALTASEATIYGRWGFGAGDLRPDGRGRRESRLRTALLHRPRPGRAHRAR